MSIETVRSFSSQLTTRWTRWNRPPESNGMVEHPEAARHLDPLFQSSLLYRSGSVLLVGIALIETVLLVPLTILARVFSWIYAAPYNFFSQRLHSSFFTIQWVGSETCNSSSHYYTSELFARCILNPKSMNTADYRAFLPRDPSLSFPAQQIPYKVRNTIQVPIEKILRCFQEDFISNCEPATPIMQITWDQPHQTYKGFIKALFDGRSTRICLSEKAQDGLRILAIAQDASQEIPVEFSDQQKADIEALQTGQKTSEQYRNELIQAESANPLFKACWKMLPNVLNQKRSRMLSDNKQS